MKKARVDEENGCEQCWNAARAAGVVDVSGDAGHVLAPAEWIGRPCTHGASECAPSILLPAVDAVHARAGCACDSDPDFAGQECPTCGAPPCRVEWHGDGSHACGQCEGDVYRVWQDGIVQELDAAEECAATAEAREWVEGGDYDRSGETYWVRATLQRAIPRTDRYHACPSCEGDECARCEGTGELDYDALTLEERCSAPREWEDVRSLRVAIEPEEPECSDDDGHAWEDDGAEGFGSVVRGNGGGVICRYRCPHCGWRRVEDSWAQDRETGEQGLHSTRYEQGEPDEAETDEEDA